MKNIKTISSQIIINKFISRLMIPTVEFEPLLNINMSIQSLSQINAYFDKFNSYLYPIVHAEYQLNKFNCNDNCNYLLFRDAVVLHTIGLIIRFLKKENNYKKYVKDKIYLYLPSFVSDGMCFAKMDKELSSASLNSNKISTLSEYRDSDSLDNVDALFNDCNLSNYAINNIPMENIFLNTIENIVGLTGIEFFDIFNESCDIQNYYGYRVIDAFTSMIQNISLYKSYIKNITQAQTINIATMHVLIQFIANFNVDSSHSPLLNRLFNCDAFNTFDETNPFVKLYIKFLSSDGININNIDKSNMTETNQAILMAIVKLINADNGIKYDDKVKLSTFVAIHTFYVIGSGLSGITTTNVVKYLYGYNTTLEPNPLLTTALNISKIDVINKYLQGASCEDIDDIILTIFTAMYRYNSLIEKNGGNSIAEGITVSDYLTSVCVNELL